MKIYQQVSEPRPIFTFSQELKLPNDKGVEITEETFLHWRQIQENFNRLQEELERIFQH